MATLEDFWAICMDLIQEVSNRWIFSSSTKSAMHKIINNYVNGYNVLEQDLYMVICDIQNFIEEFDDYNLNKLLELFEDIQFDCGFELIDNTVYH